MANKKEQFFKKLRQKYRLTIYNDQTIQEVFSFHLSRMNVFAYAGLFVILISIIVILMFIHTPLNIFLPAYTDSKLTRNIMDNALRVDSIEKEIIVRDRYFENIKNIMQGKELNNYESVHDTNIHYDDINFTVSKHDSILRNQIEEQEQNNLSVIENTKSNNKLNNLHFSMPVKGMVINKFNLDEDHYGVDFVAGPDEPIMATLDGTVIFADWSLATGYIIQVQHENSLISIYKHNSVLLKKVGDHITAGESIAIIGNSGEQTTGPHLHFELWHNGIPLNPEDYIAF